MTGKALLLASTVLLSTLAPLSAQAVQTRIYDKREFVPTAFHEVIYRMMEICSGIDGKYEDIRWFTAQIMLVGDPALGNQLIGAWARNPETGIAQIILERESVFDGNTVSHEALHDLYNGLTPMDTAHKCVLDWSRLSYIWRTEG